jgi:carbonic anhydrase
MKNLHQLFKNNRQWASKITEVNPDFFRNLKNQQTPEYLWIGCSDSRVPANDIVGLLPGELFVHRNIANLVIHTDMNCLSVLQYAVDILKVKHVIVCGHYGCGGIKAAMENQPHGLVDNWLRNIRDTWRRNQAELEMIPDESQRNNRLCELNVCDQVINVGNTTIIQDAWRRGQETTIHGWIYDLADGLLKDFGVCVSSCEDLQIPPNKIPIMTSKQISGENYVVKKQET